MSEFDFKSSRELYSTPANRGDNIADFRRNRELGECLEATFYFKKAQCQKEKRRDLKSRL